MSLHKKKGRWYAAVYLGIVDGKQVYDWSEGFDKKKDAELKELEMKKDVLERNHRVRPKESLGSIAESWLKMKEKTIAKVSWNGYVDCYNIYIKDRFEYVQVKDIEKIDINNFMLDLDYKPSTIKKIMSTLKQILDYAVNLDYIKYNPTIGIKKPNVKFTKKNTWNINVITNFLSNDIVKKSPAYTALFILFQTGMRPGEVCGLTWDRFDGEAFNPEHGISKDGEVTDLKNEKAHDPVYLTDELISHLKKLRNLHKNLYLSQGKVFNINGYICCHADDMRPLTPNYLTHEFKKLLKKTGYSIDPIRLYDTRHSFGTNMMKNKVNPKMVAEMMRHTDVRTTLNNYSHPDKDMYKETIDTYKINVK